ncbi:MAG: DUF4375 domain-containing protein [Verrucomicrobiota bacterium]
MKKDYRIRKRQIEETAEQRIREKLIETIWDDVDDLNSPTFKRLWNNLSSGQQALFGISLLESEVDNGGIHQFFFNSSGLLAHEALDGLKTLRAKKHVELLEKVFALFPDEKIPKQRKQRQKLLKQVTDKITEKIFDRPFYRLSRNRGTSLDSYVLKYLASHPDEFFISNKQADALEAEERRQKDDHLQQMRVRDYRSDRSKSLPDIFSNSIFDPRFRSDLKIAIKAHDDSLGTLLNVLTPGQKALMLARWLDIYGEDFFVAQGHFFADTLKSLRLVGANEYAKLLESVWEQLPEKPIQPESKARHVALKSRTIEDLRKKFKIFAAFSDSFERLNNDAEKSLRTILGAYIASHPTEFFRN